MKVKDLKKEFEFLTIKEIEVWLKCNDYKTERGIRNFLKRKNEENKNKASRRSDIKKLEIDIEWSRSKVWGFCPTASYCVTYTDGTGEYENRASHASGCGYDKESTVVAEICNKVFSGKLYAKRRTKVNIPYGVVLTPYFPRFEGGVGMSCYYEIAKFLGGNLKHVARGKNFDKWEFTFK